MRHEYEKAPHAGVAHADASSPRRTSEHVEQRDAKRSGALRDRLDFLREFIAHPDQVGSVIPSSHVLEQRLVRCAQLAQARCVVELGPGTGGTTRAFLRALPAQSKLLAVELNDEFAARLRSTLRDQRLAVWRGSAEHIGRVLEEHRLPAPDAVLSGIPFSTMPAQVAHRIASEIARVLAPGGRFVAYQVRAHVADYAAPYLGQPRKDWELLNIPPVRVFTWTKRG